MFEYQKVNYMNKSVLLVLILILGIIGFGFLNLSKNKTKAPKNETNVSLRLQWVPQAQFAGYIVAKEKGFYKDSGLNVDLRPAGPDLKPQSTVAAGTDDIGVGVSNVVITARSNNVPLVTIAQIFQDSANRYVLKQNNKINSLTDLKGKKVGLWTGGDEVEFLAMLKKTGMKSSDVTIVPQGFEVTPFLQNQFVLSQVTVYNELNLLRAQGYTDDKLQILSPADYDSAIVSDNIFTTEKYLNEHRKVVEAFLKASLHGWQYAIDHPEETVDIIVRYSKELHREQQKLQLAEVLKLVKARSAAQHGIGYINEKDYQTAERILFDSGQITKHVDVSKTIDLGPWRAATGK